MEKNIIDFKSFREKKEAEKDIARGRVPLHVSHLTGRVTGSPHFKRPQADDFGSRMQRIKTSLEKINRLMVDLKKSTRDQDIRN